MKLLPIHLALAGVFHDVGKLYQRAYGNTPPPGLEPPDHSHVGYTYAVALRFWELWEKTGLGREEFAELAARHHEGWKDRYGGRYVPKTAGQWAVALADSYASSEREGGAGQGVPSQTPLSSPFAGIVLDGREGERVGYSQVYDLPGHRGVVGLSEGGFYPRETPNVRQDTYGRLVERFEKRLEELKGKASGPEAVLSGLLATLEEVASLVPADTQADPSVSLYDHLRLTGAIAAALWAYHGGSPSVQDLKEEGEKLLLVLGDFGGIQDHIYRIQGGEAGIGGLAKRLRARSLEVSLATEALGLGLLDRLGLPPLLRILSAGGRFYLLLPNTEGAKGVLEEAAKEWEGWALEQGGSLVPLLAWTPFSPKGFSDFGEVLRKGHERLGRAKLQPFHRVLGKGLPWARPLRPCALCGARPAQRDEPGSLCVGCEAAEKVGRRLPRSQGVGFSKEKPDPPHFRFPGLYASLEGGAYTLRARLDYTPGGAPFEVKPLLGHLATVGDALKALGCSLEGYEEWAKEKGLDLEEPPHPDRPLTFTELAALSEGVAYLGGLMLDADRMGEVFAGLQNASPSRIASLSRSFNLFFSAEVLALIKSPGLYQQRLDWGHEVQKKVQRYPLLYSVYAGGDDLFLLGPWDVVLEFALDLEKLYRSFTRHFALTLSGGFALFRPKAPIPQMADTLREAEKQAKAAGRNRLYLFGEAVEWKELEKLKSWALNLESDLRDGLSKAKVYRILELFRTYRLEKDEAQRMRYKPLLSYLLRDLDQGLKERYFRLLDHQDPAWRHLPVWVFWGLYRLREG